MNQQDDQTEETENAKTRSLIDQSRLQPSAFMPPPVDPKAMELDGKRLFNNNSPCEFDQNVSKMFPDLFEQMQNEQGTPAKV